MKILEIIDENNIKNNITQESYERKYIYNLYIEQNYSKEEILKKLNISNNVFCQILKHFNIKKDSRLIYNNQKRKLLNKYGVSNISQIQEIKDKKKQKSLEKYGVDNISKAKEVQQKKDCTFLEHYGVNHYFKTKEFKDKVKQLNIDKYGVEHYSQTQECKDKVTNRVMINFGIPWACMREEARIRSSNNSKPNNDFSKKLDECNISYTREFILNNYNYDFKIGNTLVEINPNATHNINWSPFTPGHKSKISKDYHLNKTENASESNFRCIHVWDWDNQEAILGILKEKDTIGARECVVKEVDQKQSIKFINQFHIQGYAKANIYIGLFYKEELVSIMSFGKPRYNKNYQYELVRYCSSKNIIGGANKIFTYFKNKYKPKSIISYCDLSKFTGETYLKLGFNLLRTTKPARHWVKLDTKEHYTDNLIRQQGFSRIVNKIDYTKDTIDSHKTNEELMYENGYLEVYDCGQAVYVIKDLN